MKKDPRHADILRSSRKIKQHRRLSHWFWSGFGVLVLVLVLVVLANLAIFKISEIKITGARVANASDLIQLIDRDLTGRRFFIFPRRNAWFYPEAEIRERIDKKFLNIEAVAFNLANIFNHPLLSIEIRERQPTVRLCRDVTTSECYLTDRQGLIFAPAPEFSRHIFPTIIQPLIANPIGARPLSLNEFSKLLDARRDLEKTFPHDTLSGFVIYQIEILAAGDYSFTAENPLNPEERFEILVNADKDLGFAVTNAQIALSSPALVDGLEKNGRSLEYLDLRFAPKVFYKFRPVI